MFKHSLIHAKLGFKLVDNLPVLVSNSTPRNMAGNHFTTNTLMCFKVVIIGVLLFGLAACSTNSKKSGGQDSQKDLGILLSYNERDSDKNTYQVEIFINSKYMHISDSQSKGDYILFDRKKAVIYNVNADDKTIFVIKNRSVDIESPLDIQYELVSQPSAAIPEVQGNTATHYRFNVNGKHCYDAVSMEIAFMPDAVKAMKEYRNVLAGEHAKTVNKIPEDMLDACDLALNVFYPSKYLDNGLPMREWDRKGYRRFLESYKFNVKMPNEKLSLPDGYEKYSVAE